MTTLSEVLGEGRVEEIPRKPPPPALVIEVSYSGGCWRRFDLVKFFEKMADQPSEQQAYWITDLNEWGYFQEWERPMAVLLAWDEPEVSFGIGSEACLYDDNIMIDVDDVRVKVRNHIEVPYGADARRWTEADRDLLVGIVSWMRRDDDDPMTREDLARIPGPLDSPLF